MRGLIGWMVLVGACAPAEPVDELAPVPQELQAPAGCSVAKQTDVAGTDVVEIAALCRLGVVEAPYEVQQDAARRQIKDVLRYAHERALRVSVAGGRTTGGGHVHHPDGLVLDLAALRGVEVEGTTVRALAGSTFADIDAASPDHTVAARPGGGPATVGGWLGALGYGSDPRCGVASCVVESFRVVQWDGRVVEARRDDPRGTPGAMLYANALGGFGLFGVLVDATLDLEPRVKVSEVRQTLDRADYGTWVAEDLAGEGAVVRHAARVAMTPEGGLGPGVHTLHLVRDPEGSETLYEPEGAEGSLQQSYFVPVASVATFLDGLERTRAASGVALRGVVLRYLPAAPGVVLGYTPEPRVAVQIGFDPPEDLARAQAFTTGAVDAALAVGGSYHLGAPRWPSREQLVAAYPRFESFGATKRRADPFGRFANAFWIEYAQ